MMSKVDLNVFSSNFFCYICTRVLEFKIVGLITLQEDKQIICIDSTDQRVEKRSKENCFLSQRNKKEEKRGE